MQKRPTGSKILTIGLVSDTHCNEAEDFSASPYPANAEANPRARWAFACLNHARPDFVVHLGDMINPVPGSPTYAPAAEQFREIAADLKAPLHVMPGNHDIGDKPVGWMPAGMICDEFIALYESHFGKSYYAIEQVGLIFIVLNASLINSGLAAEASQRDWLEQTLVAHQGARTFIFIHYPPYVSDPNEPESYDNIGEPGRSWLLDLVRRYQPEALFAAHVHNFWYDVVGETETYILPSTCFVRHDYSELNRISAGDQFGRNDADKLGFVLLDIYEHGHVARYVRSYGLGLEKGRGIDVEFASDGLRSDPAIHTKTSTFNNLGVDMRHSWAEELDVAPSGAVDEFSRKKARNDYPVMALWEMGLRRMRVPLQDLTNERTRRRMKLMHAVGNFFNVYCYGVPTGADMATIVANAPLIDRLEVVLDWSSADVSLVSLKHFVDATGISILVSRVNRKDADKYSGNRFNHLISHGFARQEADEVAATLKRHGLPASQFGVMFTIPRSDDPIEAVRWAAEFERMYGFGPCLYIKSTSASPAEAFIDDHANAVRILQAAMAASAFRNVEVILDTFADADRGYFVRTGLVDRRYNLRLAGRLIATLVSHVEGGDWNIVSNSLGDKQAGTPQLTILNNDGDYIQLVTSTRDDRVNDVWLKASESRTRLSSRIRSSDELTKHHAEQSRVDS